MISLLRGWNNVFHVFANISENNNCYTDTQTQTHTPALIDMFYTFSALHNEDVDFSIQEVTICEYNIFLLRYFIKLEFFNINNTRRNSHAQCWSVNNHARIQECCSLEVVFQWVLHFSDFLTLYTARPFVITFKMRSKLLLDGLNKRFQRPI